MLNKNVNKKVGLIITFICFTIGVFLILGSLMGVKDNIFTIIAIITGGFALLLLFTFLKKAKEKEGLEEYVSAKTKEQKKQGLLYEDKYVLSKKERKDYTELKKQNPINEKERAELEELRRRERLRREKIRQRKAEIEQQKGVRVPQKAEKSNGESSKRSTR